jgi:DHA1 family bicyclomycin/chloramphenicol resistance-like MFS transporter
LTLDPPARLGRVEFIALVGMIYATVAFSIDAMLPALPEIALALTPERQTLALLVVTSFVLGLGVGTLFTGPLSDSYGRKPVIFWGGVLYCGGAALAWQAQSLDWLLAARVIQGLGAAGPRVVVTAIIRDLYKGREMAQIMSFAMLIFTLFPAIAPLIGAAIIWGFGWRAIFVAFLGFSLISVGWLMLRQAETLPAPARRPFRLSPLWQAMKEALALRQMQLSILAQMMVFGCIFGAVSSVQGIFDQAYGMAASFPVWFAAMALLSAPAAPVNGMLVIRLGMRPLVRRAMAAQMTGSVIVAALVITGLLGPFEVWVFAAWGVTVFALAGFSIGNLNALALEPLGHIAGMAASIMGALATIGGAVIGSVIGQLFDGTAVPLILSCGVLSATGAVIMAFMPREQVVPG